MKLPSMIFAVAIALGVSGASGLLHLPRAVAETAPAQAAATERTQTFAVENMTCALCPVTVKTAMEHVAGVKTVRVDFDAKTATVTYDPSVAAADKIAAASTNAGYPAKLVKGGS